MMIFSEDTEIARSIPTRIASYSTLFLDVGKSNRITYSIISLVGALSCKPTPAPVCWEAPSILRIHQSTLLRSASYWGIYAKKSANISPFISKWGFHRIPNSLSSIAY